MKTHQLAERVESLRRRALLVQGMAGAGRGTLAALGVLIAGAWVDLAIDLNSVARVMVWFVVAGTALVPVVRAFRRWAAMATSTGLSRVLDGVAKTRGEIHAGLDLLLHPTPAMAGSGVTDGLRGLAIQRAAGLANAIPSSYVVPVQPVLRVMLMLIAAAIGLGLFSLMAPRMVAAEFLRFSDPYGDHPPYSPLVFSVEPGNAKVLYGGNLQIKASVSGGVPEQLDLVVSSDDLKTSDSLPMFSDPASGWQATVTNVTAVGWYTIRAGNARSERFRLDVITVPKIEAARVRITPPEYTNLPPYEGLIPPGGIAGLPGTKVDLTLKSNRPLSGGEVQFTSDSKMAAVSMKPLKEGGDEVSGSFTLVAPGRLNAKVMDIAEQQSVDPLSANLVLTADERPLVRIIQPLAQSFATPSIELPVELSAEDDYGISKLQLFRGINDAKNTSQDIPVAKPAPTQISHTTMLPLSTFGLKAGDTLRLFAHVEDTNPAGPGASDSSVVIVTIISEEEMQKLVLARQSMETLQSKYEEANLRLEEVNKQIEELQKELPADQTPLTNAQRKKLDDLAKNMEKESQAVRESQKQDLPFDLDKALRENLGKVADAMDQAKQQTKSMSGQAALTTAGAKDRLHEMAKQLQGKHQDFAEQATDPLQRLAEVFALQEDQAKFEQLYDQQRDLEMRLHSMRDKNGQDNPELKNRMRDLEDEQRGVREDLQKLLNDIDTHTAALPADPGLDKLRQTAKAFSKAARESTIVEEMASGESGLAGFSGLLGHDGAKVAADLMEAMLSKCHAVGQDGSSCLKFQPHLAQELGNTVQQMLEAEGLGSKPGNLPGWMPGGYSMQSHSLQNVGLYGLLPNRSQVSKLGGGHAERGANADGWGRNQPGATDVVDAHGRQKASGGSDASVPSQYRRQVGDYFQRVTDDLGDQK